MSSQIEEFTPVSMGVGASLRIFIDHSKPEDSLEYNWVEANFDGKEDSDMVVVPHHWHKYHDETVEVLEGRLICFLDGKDRVISAGDPPLLIPRGHIHGFNSIKGVPMRVKERTIPGGDFKARFFQDLFQSGPGFPGFFMAMRAFSEGDNYPALPGGFKFIDYWFLTIVAFLAKPFVPVKPAALKRMT